MLAEKSRRSKTDLLTHFEQKASLALCEESTEQDTEDLDFLKLLKEKSESKDHVKKIVKLMKKIWKSDK